MDKQSRRFRATAAMWQRMRSVPLVQIVVAILFVAVPFAMISTALDMFVTNKPLRRVGALLLAAVVLAGYSGYVRLVERRSLAELSGGGAIKEVGFGFGLGALLFSATIEILAGLGVYQVTGTNAWQSMLALLPTCILAGILEEVLIRGILFRILELWLGSWIALSISAIIFGALHLFNPGASLLDAAAISVEAGVLLAAAFMLTRRLWLCIGIHTAWNFTQGGIFSVAISGGKSQGLLQSKMIGPDWLTGGAFGAEASVVALVVCTAAGILMIYAAVRKGNVVPPLWARKVALV